MYFLVRNRANTINEPVEYCECLSNGKSFKVILDITTIVWELFNKRQRTI